MSDGEAPANSTGVPDLIGPALTLPEQLVQALDEQCRILAETAAVAERFGVQRSRIDALVSAGLTSLSVPQEFGGQGLPPALAREVTERVAGACGTTWFVLTQHRSALDAVLTTTNPVLIETWRRDVAQTRALGAVAFAHLRRSGPPQVVAEPTTDGWEITGELDWVTGWSVADVLALMCRTADGRVVEALITANPRPGMKVSAPLSLMAMGGTQTVAITLDRLRVTHDEVAHVRQWSQWCHLDNRRTVNTPPAVFGVLRSVVGALARIGMRRESDATSDLAQQYATRVRELRTQAYDLMDHHDPDELHGERLAIRARALETLQQASAALVAATGGSAMSMDRPEQRWARESLFLLVQAQTADLREQLIKDWSLA